MVVDASVAVKWFIEEPGRDAAMTVIRSGDTLSAPDLVLVEIMNVLRRKHRQRMLDQTQLTQTTETLKTCFSYLMPATSLVDEALRFSIALEHSVYDCAYLACAVILDARLVTADRVFAAKVQQVGHNNHIVTLNGP